MVKFLEPLKITILIIILLGCICDIFGQNKQPLVYASFGYTKIPLQIKRTKVSRWMTYPTFKAGYRLSQNLTIHSSFMANDASIKNYSKEDLQKFKEVPPLTSYETAKMYKGEKFTLSLFHDYIFAGIQYKYFSSRFLDITTDLDIGYRFGETELLTNIIANQFWPNGFEVHSTLLSSDSPGIRLAISPIFSFFNFLTVELSAGNYLFLNWPVVQLFGNLQLGISF